MSVYSGFASRLMAAARTQPLRGMLLTSVPPSSATTVAGLAGLEVSGGTRPAIPTWVAYDAETDVVSLQCDPVSFGQLTAEISSVVVYADSGSAASSLLVLQDVFDGPVDVEGREFVYAPPATGLISMVL